MTQADPAPPPHPEGGADPYPWRLIVCDVDSTIITGEVIEMLAARAGCLPEVERITSEAMNGQWDFEESLRRRVALLAGLDATALDEVGRTLELTPGAAPLMDSARRAGLRRGVVSGGFEQVTKYLVAALELDFGVANTLDVVDGVLTGGLVGAVVDRAAKATILREQAAVAGIPTSATVAIGDGANDIDLFEAAGLAIAFNPKPALRPHADYVIEGPTLGPVIELLGLPSPGKGRRQGSGAPLRGR